MVVVAAENLSAGLEDEPLIVLAAENKAEPAIRNLHSVDVVAVDCNAGEKLERCPLRSEGGRWWEEEAK